MDRLLRKRLPRDFKSNIGRYFALTFLIALGIYVIVSMVGAADMFIMRTEESKSINMSSFCIWIIIHTHINIRMFFIYFYSFIMYK